MYCCRLALPLWILCCFLSTYLSLLYGAICLMLTGACLLWACVVFIGVHTIESRLVIPIDENQQLTLSYGWGFILSLTTGLLCMIVGLVLTIVVCYQPLWAARVFGTSLLEVDDEGEEEDAQDDDETHDYEHIRPRLLTFVAGAPTRPTKPSNGEVTSPGAFSRSSFRSSFRRRHLTRQPSTLSGTSANSQTAAPRVLPRQWRRPRPTSSLSMSVVQSAFTGELRPVSSSNLSQANINNENSGAGVTGAAAAEGTPVAEPGTSAQSQPQQQQQQTTQQLQQQQQQATIILYNAVEVPRRPNTASGMRPTPAKRTAVPQPPARTVSRLNTGTSLMHTEGVSYTTGDIGECTL